MKCKIGTIFTNNTFGTNNIDEISFEHQNYDIKQKKCITGSLNIKSLKEQFKQ
jgi:hypothetical protein